MRPLTTLVLLGLTAAAACFILFHERWMPSSRQTQEQARFVLQIPPEEITKIEITNAAGELVLERAAPQGWRISAPVDDRADQAAVQEALGLASSTEVVERLPAEQLEIKRAFGLDPGNHVRVVFHQKNGVHTTALVGRPAAFQDTIYFQVKGPGPGPDDVLIARSKVRAVLLKAPGEWRDPRLLALGPEDVSRIGIRGPQGEVVVGRDMSAPGSKRQERALWRIIKPLEERADQELVSDHLLPGLMSARALAFAEALPATASAEPAVRIEVAGGSPERSETLEVFAHTEPGTAWVRSSLRPGIARTNGELLDLQLLNLARLRDIKLASIDPRKTTTISLTNDRGKNTLLYQAQGRWLVQHEGIVQEANRERIQKLIEVMNSAVTVEAFDQPATLLEYGLEKPFLEITFGGPVQTDRTKPVLLTPENSVTLRLGELHRRFYAQWVGRPTVYRFDGAILGDVATEAIHYKSARLVSFPPLSVKELSITRETDPPLTLTFDLSGGARWKASRQDTDITEFLDLPRVERLINRLSELTAHDWSLVSTAGLEALKSPSLQLSLTVEKYDEANGQAHPATVQLAFAPLATRQRSALYYGRRNDEPDVFVVRRALYEELAAPVLRPPPTNAATGP